MTSMEDKLRIWREQKAQMKKKPGVTTTASTVYKDTPTKLLKDQEPMLLKADYARTDKPRRFDKENVHPTGTPQLQDGPIKLLEVPATRNRSVSTPDPSCHQETKADNRSNDALSTIASAQGFLQRNEAQRAETVLSSLGPSARTLPEYWITRATANEKLGNLAQVQALHTELKQLAQQPPAAVSWFQAFFTRKTASVPSTPTRLRFSAQMSIDLTPVQESRATPAKSTPSVDVDLRTLTSATPSKSPAPAGVDTLYSTPSKVSTPAGFSRTPLADALHRFIQSDVLVEQSRHIATPLSSALKSLKADVITDPEPEEIEVSRNLLSSLRDDCDHPESSSNSEAHSVLPMNDESPVHSPLKSRTDSRTVSSLPISPVSPDSPQQSPISTGASSLSPLDRIAAKVRSPETMVWVDPSVSSLVFTEEQEEEQEEQEEEELDLNLVDTELLDDQFMTRHPLAEIKLSSPSSVVVLSPIRAKPSIAKLVGSETVLSPVRRSTRKGANRVAPSTQSLLEQTNYAYVPNPAIPVEKKSPVKEAFDAAHAQLQHLQISSDSPKRGGRSPARRAGSVVVMGAVRRSKRGDSPMPPRARSRLPDSMLSPVRRSSRLHPEQTLEEIQQLLMSTSSDDTEASASSGARKLATVHEVDEVENDEEEVDDDESELKIEEPKNAKVCQHCNTSRTSSWVTTTSGATLCYGCNAYLQKHGKTGKGTPVRISTPIAPNAKRASVGGMLPPAQRKRGSSVPKVPTFDEVEESEMKQNAAPFSVLAAVSPRVRRAKRQGTPRPPQEMKRPRALSMEEQVLGRVDVTVSNTPVRRSSRLTPKK